MILEDYYPLFLRTGNSPLLFWELSLKEIVDVIDAYEMNQEIKFKDDIAKVKILADMIYERIGSLFSEKETEFTPVWDMFPGLFEKEKEIVKENQKKVQMENYKAQWINFANRVNGRR